MTAPLPDLRADNTDTKIRTQGGATIRDDTPPRHHAVITTQAGPESVKTTDLTGASSGDHTHQAIWIGEHQVIPGHPEGQSNGQTSSDKSGEYAAFGAS